MDPTVSNPTIVIPPSGRFDLPVPHGHLEALLKEPAQARLAAIVCHPHPRGGGTMSNNVVYRVAKALVDSGAAVLRFNFRGVGRSTGTYGEGIAEAEDVRAGLDFMAARHPSLPLWLAGFSFGARVGLEVGMNDARVAKLLGVGLAVRMFDLRFLERDRDDKPLAVIQAANDEYGARDEVQTFVAGLAKPTQLWIVNDATHLFPGKLDELEAAVAQAIVWLDNAE